MQHDDHAKHKVSQVLRCLGKVRKYSSIPVNQKFWFMGTRTSDDERPFLMHATGFKTKRFSQPCTKEKYDKEVQAMTEYEELHHDTSSEELLRQVREANKQIRVYMLKRASKDEEPTTLKRKRAQVRGTFFLIVFYVF